jgi:site-specific DNA recombinase
MGWMTEALPQSHEDERCDHEEAITRLQAGYTRFQNRIEAMYVDKFDGRVDTIFFDWKAAEWRAEQERLRRAHELFQKQEPREKRRLLDFVLSKCTWKGGELRDTVRQPFNLIIASTTAYQHKKDAGVASNGLFENWRGA